MTHPKALAYHLDDLGLCCVSCADAEIQGEFRHLFFAMMRPKEVVWTDQCPSCDRTMGDPSHEAAVDRIIAEVRSGDGETEGTG